MTLSSSDRRQRKPGGRVRRAAQASRSAFLWFVFASICLVAAVLSLARWWLPGYVEDNQTQLVRAIGDNMGVELSTADMQLHWSHWGPSLLMSSLQVDVPGVETPLTLEAVEASLDIRQLVQFRKLVVDEVTLRGIAFEVRRDESGEWMFAFDRGQREEAGLESALAAVSRFGWINVEDASLRMRDDSLGTIYDISNIKIVANNRTGHTRISVDADLPASLGGHVRAVADLLIDPEKGVSGQTYLNVDRVALDGFSGVFGARDVLPVGDVQDLQVWSLLDAGRVERLQYRVAGDRVALRDAADAERWYIDFFSGGGGWQREQSGWSAWLDDTVLARDGVAWRPGRTTLEHRDGQWLAGGQLLRVEEIRDLLLPWRHMPHIAPVAEWLEGSSPSGEIALWKLVLPPTGSDSSPPPDNDSGGPATPGRKLPVLPAGLKFEAVLSDWSNRRFEDLPGVENLDAALRLVDGRFSVRLQGQGSTLDMPAVFRTPLQFDLLSAQLDGELKADSVWLVSDDVIVDTPHFRMNTRFAFNPSDDGRGMDMDVRSSIRDLDGRYLSTYYPVGAMPANLQKWLESSLQGGRVTEGELLLVGNSADYPFRTREGRMDLRLAVQDLGMRYHPDWPELTDMDGDFVLDGVGARYEGSARVLNGSLQRVVADIPAFSDARMNFDTQWRGESDTLVTWLREGPLAASVGRHFKGIEVTGPVAVRLKPDFGLRPGMRGTISGDAQFSDADLTLTGPDLSFQSVRARIPFNEQGILGHELSGQYLGSPVNAVVTTTADQRAVRIEAATEIDLGPWLEEREVPVASWFDGRSAWDVTVDVVASESGDPARVSLSARSDLSGVQISAPDPVAKDASIRRDVRVRAEIGSADRDLWRVQFGEDLQIVLASRDAKVEALSLGAGLPAPTLPEDGVRARVEWPAADLERWYTALEDCCFADDTASAESAGVDVFARVDRATWLGAPVGLVSLQLQQAGPTLEGRVSGDLLEGRFNYVAGTRPTLTADLTRLDVSPLMEAEFEISEAPPSHPRDYPATEISLREVQVDNLRFTDVYLKTQPAASGLALSELVVRSPLYTAQGSGQWVQNPDGREESALQLFAHTNDVGLAVADMGRVGSLTGGRGQLNIDANWLGELWAPDFASLTGGINFELADGRVNDLDPGAGRVFGLLALQTLPQRLSLDFSDLGDGLGYEVVKGDFALGGGKAVAKALLLEGPVGVVSVVGPIDYINRQYDQRIVVLPNVGGSLPLIGAFVGGPLTAASVYLADKVLRSMGVDVNQFGRQDYSLTGDFDSPELNLILLEDTPASIASDGSER